MTKRVEVKLSKYKKCRSAIIDDKESRSERIEHVALQKIFRQSSFTCLLLGENHHINSDYSKLGTTK